MIYILMIYVKFTTWYEHFNCFYADKKEFWASFPNIDRITSPYTLPRQNNLTPLNYFSKMSQWEDIHCIIFKIAKRTTIYNISLISIV